MKKAILYLRTDLCDKEVIAGGSVSHTLGVLEGFAFYKYTIICASSIMQNVLKECTYLNQLILLKNPSSVAFLRWKLNCLLSNIFFTVQLFLVCKNNRVDFIYQRYSILNCTGIILSRLKKIPIILEYNGSETWVSKNWDVKKRFSFHRVMDLIERINIVYADYITVVSAALKDELISRGIDSNKILINPNGVSPEVFDAEKLTEARTRIRTQLSLEDKFVFGFVGTFGPWHGINILKAIIPGIIVKNKNVHFLLIGDGPLAGQLQERLLHADIVSHVTFTGILSHQDAKDYLSACDAFLCPTQPNQDGSRFFGSPTKLFEYMSLAKPIIASNLEQIAEILQPALENSYEDLSNTMNGILLHPQKPDDFIALAAKLVSTHSSILKTIGSNARNKVINNYSWHIHVKKIINFTRNE
jgi:glycosyltransferase involved in cell wall biosynthesis